jgi:phosphopantetheinyl transferase
MSDKLATVYFVEFPKKNSFQENRKYLHHLVKKEIAKKLDLSIDEVSFSYTETKKPIFILNNQEPIHFNISHTNKYGAFALSIDSPAGIDIEERHTVTNLPEMASLVCTAEEVQMLKSNSWSDKSDIFLKLWTLKESLLKAIGDGFYTCPRNYDFSKQQDIYTHSSYKSYLIKDLSPNIIGSITLQSSSGYVFYNL